MLKLAYEYESELNYLIQNIAFNDKYKYYNYSSWWNYSIILDKDSWNNIQLVSISKDNEILGYFSARFNRSDNKISGLSVINFCNKDNIVFSKDMYKFIVSLFYKFNARKVEFSVIVNNPIEKMYNKFIKKYHGHVVGKSKKSVQLENGVFYDEKFYEIFRKDFIKYFNNKKIINEVRSLLG